MTQVDRPDISGRKAIFEVYLKNITLDGYALLYTYDSIENNRVVPTIMFSAFLYLFLSFFSGNLSLTLPDSQLLPRALLVLILPISAMKPQYWQRGDPR